MLNLNIIRSNTTQSQALGYFIGNKEFKLRMHIHIAKRKKQIHKVIVLNTFLNVLAAVDI